MPRVHRLVQRARRFPWLFAGIAFVYLFFIPYFRVLNNPNENARVYQIRAAVELHKLSVNEQIDRYGRVNDLARVGKLYYSGKAPGMNVLGIPAYAALRAVDSARGVQTVPPFRLLYTLRLSCVLLPVLVFLIAFRRFLMRFTASAPLADILTIVLAVGTMLLPYSLLFVNHSLTAASAAGALMAAEYAHEDTGLRRGAWLFLSGFLLAFCTAADHALFPVSCMLLVYSGARAGRSVRPWLVLCGGAAIPTLLTAAYNQICWGSPFKTSIGFLANPEFAKNQSQGLFGLVGPSAVSVYNILISPAKGLFFFSPVFLLAAAALIYACIRSEFRRIAILSSAITFWMILYACSLTNWDAGWTVGPRYAAVIVPFCTLGLALAYRELSNTMRLLFIPIGLILALLSMVLTALPSVVFPHLPPESQNPVFELIWPLWRDGFTPYVVLEPLVSLKGRAAQVPFLIVLGALMVGVLWMGVGLLPSPIQKARSLGRRIALSAVLCAGAAVLLYGAALPRSPDMRPITASLQWIERSVWEP